MRIRPIVLAALHAAWLGAGPITTVSAGELSEAAFRRLHEQLRPSAKDVWRSIPWKISLLDAQRLAAKERRPLFIWAMDGHPLGCT